KTVDIPTPDEGDLITYTITLSNSGPDNASQVQLIDRLPSGISYTAHIADRGTYSPVSGLWQVGDLAASCDPAVLTLTARVEAGTAGRTITNTTRDLIAAEPDPNPLDDAGQAAITVNGADLEVIKTISDSSPDGGDLITYTVTVLNHGPGDATGVRLVDLLPQDVSFESYVATAGTDYDSSSGLWTLGALSAGSDASLALLARIGLCPPVDFITNTASVTNVAPPDFDAGNNEAGVGLQVANKACYSYLPVAFRDYRLLVNGGFETGDLTGWAEAQGPFNGHGSGLPQNVMVFDGSFAALLGNPAAADGAIPVGYGYIAQSFTVDRQYLQIRYRVVTSDIVRGPNSGRYFDTFEVSLNAPPAQITDGERDNRGCATTLLNPDGILTPSNGLVFCGGYAGAPDEAGTQRDLGWKTVTLDLQNFQGTNITVYFSLWSREHGPAFWDDRAYYNTWVYIDDVQWQ
ncbi:MAG: DUF11 domain-containing protein, partial [Anaerolineae bacterium]